MLVELRVRDLGVIADLDLVIGPGMTALTGETGAGKTLVVEALELLLGGRADAAIVRAGAAEAVVEGRFVITGREVVLSRSVPVDGRSRAYLDGRMAPASSLSEIGDGLVDLHGQHVHQSLLHQAAQRDALDSFAGSDLEEVSQARRELAVIDARLAELGGDPRVLVRTVGLLRFQLDEIAAAAITALDEEEQLGAEESLLTQIGALRAAISEARDALTGSDATQAHSGLGATDLLGVAVSRLTAHDALSELAAPLRSAQADVEDVARELRLRDERLEEDPDRLEAIRRRLQLLADLRRKYGSTLAEVIEFERASQLQLAEFERPRTPVSACRLVGAPRSAFSRRRRNGSGPAVGRPHRNWPQRSRLTCTSSRLAVPDLRFASGKTRQDRKWSSFSGPTRESRRCLSPRSPQAGSWRGPCSLPAWSCPRHLRRSFRRGRRRRGRRGGSGSGPCVVRARARPPSVGRDPSRASRCVRRSPGAGVQDRGGRQDCRAGAVHQGRGPDCGALEDAVGPPEQRDSAPACKGAVGDGCELRHRRRQLG